MSHMNYCTDLILGKAFCIFVFFHSPDSRLSVLKGFHFYFCFLTRVKTENISIMFSQLFLLIIWEWGTTTIGHFHGDDVWLQLPEFILSLLSYLNLSIPLRFIDNSLNLHKKTANWRILVVVVKWRHRAIVLLE